MITSISEWYYLFKVNNPFKEVENYITETSKDLLDRNSLLTTGNFTLIHDKFLGTWDKSLLEECKNLEELITQMNKDKMWFKQYFQAVRLYACEYADIANCFPDSFKFTNLTFNNESYPMLFTKYDYTNRLKFYEVFKLL